MPYRVFFSGVYEVLPILNHPVQYFTNNPNATVLPINGARDLGEDSILWYNYWEEYFKEKGIELPTANELYLHRIAPDGNRDRFNPPNIMRGKKNPNNSNEMIYQHILWAEYVMDLLTSTDELACWSYSAINDDIKCRALAKHINSTDTLNYYGPTKKILHGILVKNVDDLYNRVLAGISARRLELVRTYINSLFVFYTILTILLASSHYGPEPGQERCEH